MISLLFKILILLKTPELVMCVGDQNNTDKSRTELELEHSGRDECDAILSSWVGKVQPLPEPENLTMSVRLNNLYEALREKECFSYNQLWLELWWVTESSNNPRPENFGSESYFSKYERCHRLEPEHFVFHSTKRLDTRLNETTNSQVAKFNHIVEHEYILRICPCGRRRQSLQGSIKVCDCKYSETGKPHCSTIVSINPGPQAVVYPWCRQSNIALTDAGDVVENVTTKIVVHSPVVNCTSVLFTGIMASCTPLQSYDRVQLSLHIVDTDDQYIDLLNFECNQHQHFGQDDPIIIETNIHNINGSHGDFSVYLGMLAPQSVYCLQIELVDHPYCNSHLMIGHMTGPSPKVCASHMAHPVITPMCAESHGQTVKRTGNSFYLIAILAVGLAVVIGIGVLCIACACVKIKRRSQSYEKGPRSKEYRHGHRSIPRPVSGFSSHSLEAAALAHLDPLYDEEFEKVFLLRLPNSPCSEDVHIMFREWMESLGCQVHDIENSEQEESINSDPEGWVQQVLSNSKVKVVVIEGSSGVSVEAKDLETRCLLRQTSGPPSTCTVISTSTATSSLTGSSASSEDGRRMSKCHDEHHIDGMDTEPLLQDHRYELRIFAWKFIQSNFVGKYNQLLLVRFSVENKAADCSSNTVLSLTPFRQSFLIPHHLPEVRNWLRPSKAATTSKLSSTSQKTIDVCEKRLCSALLTSQYDCI